MKTQLITQADYQHFLDEQAANGRYYHPAHWLKAHFLPGQAQKPIVGIHATAATAFCTWLTEQSADQTWQYRLPQPHELTLEIIDTLLDTLPDDQPLAYWLMNGDYEMAAGTAPHFPPHILAEQLRHDVLVLFQTIHQPLTQAHHLAHTQWQAWQTALTKLLNDDLDQVLDRISQLTQALIADLSQIEGNNTDDAHDQAVDRAYHLSIALRQALNPKSAVSLTQVHDLVTQLVQAQNLVDNLYDWHQEGSISQQLEITACMLAFVLAEKEAVPINATESSPSLPKQNAPQPYQFTHQLEHIRHLAYTAHLDLIHDFKFRMAPIGRLTKNLDTLAVLGQNFTEALTQMALLESEMRAIVYNGRSPLSRLALAAVLDQCHPFSCQLQEILELAQALATDRPRVQLIIPYIEKASAHLQAGICALKHLLYNPLITPVYPTTKEIHLTDLRQPYLNPLIRALNLNRTDLSQTDRRLCRIAARIYALEMADRHYARRQAAPMAWWQQWYLPHEMPIETEADGDNWFHLFVNLCLLERRITGDMSPFEAIVVIKERAPQPVIAEKRPSWTIKFKQRLHKIQVPH